jgi:pimeloyl-ACP methyl ester carboxylesterase
MLFSKPKTFDQYFEKVPVEQKEQLLDFRERAAYVTIQSNQKTWQYRKIGSGDQAMVLLPGGFTLADIWMKTAEAFADTHRLLMPDAYARQEIYAVDQVCEAILAMMDAEAVTQAIFIGVAAGGELAQYFLHKHPERMSHLIISHCDTLGDIEAIHDLRTRNTLNFYNRTTEGMIRTFMLSPLEKNLPTDSDWRDFALAYYRESIQGLKKKMVQGYVKNSHAMKKNFEFMAARIRTWQGQLLYLASEDDNITLKSIAPLKKFYPAAKVHRFDQGQNHVHILYPDLVNQVIRDFLADTEKDHTGDN